MTILKGMNMNKEEILKELQKFCEWVENATEEEFRKVEKDSGILDNFKMFEDCDKLFIIPECGKIVYIDGKKTNYILPGKVKQLK